MLVFLLLSLMTSETDPSDSDEDEGFSSTPLPKRTPSRRTKPQSNDENFEQKCGGGDLCSKSQPIGENL